MPKQINLLGKISANQTPSVVTRTTPLLGGSFLLSVLIVLVAGASSIYAYKLENDKKAVERDITIIEQKIASFKEIEQKKGVITVKTDQIQKLYAGRFDYVKAIDDVQKLFAYSLTIKSIDLSTDKTAKVSAVKTGEIVISESEALATQIEELVLELTLPSSEELQETVDNLKRYLGAGLTSADVIDSKKLEEEEGYTVNFRLTFGAGTEENTP